MEKLQGPINPCQIIAEDMEVGNWLEEFINSTTTTAGSIKYEDPFNYYSEEGGGATYGCLPSLEDKMPFLQMLQTVEQHQQQQPFIQHFEPTNFQFLLRLQHQLVESCVTSTNHNHNNHNYVSINVGNDNNNDMVVMDIQHSAEVKSETTEIGENVEKCNKIGESGKKAQLRKKCTAAPAAAAVGGGPVKEKRKRKRAARPAKNKQEVETQRMTHIAVERNRRRQMNEHLNALRSLMPPSYVQRGDQASIIGGAIDFVKELEQMLQSLQAQKKMKQTEENGDVSVSVSVSPSSTSSSSNLNNLSNNSNVFMASPSLNSHEEGKEKGKGNEQDSGEGSVRKSNEEFSAEKKTGIAEIEVVVIQNHVNLKIKCQRRQGQLIKAIVAFEELRLTVLHLNITSLHTLVHYSFNLKIEEDCKLGTADDVARAVHQIFSLINLS